MIKEIDIRWIKGDTRWYQLQRFVLLKGVIINGYAINAGFVTDAGSIPFGFRDSFNPIGRGFPAFLSHDHKCKHLKNRKQADKEFYRDLLDCGVNPVKAQIMYRAVRLYAILAGKK